MDSSTVGERFRAACDALVYNDSLLLELNASERSLASKIASYLAGVFPAHHVDFEYNRSGVDPKRVNWGPDCERAEVSLVIPDIIIHRRGESDSNLAVCEVKKIIAGERALECDRQKLRAIKQVFSYFHALLIVLPTGAASSKEIEIEVVQ